MGEKGWNIMPPSNFDSFDQSPLGGFSESDLKARGGYDPPPAYAYKGIGFKGNITHSRIASLPFLSASSQVVMSFWVDLDLAVNEGRSVSMQPIRCSSGLTVYCQSSGFSLRVTVFRGSETLFSRSVTYTAGFHNILISIDTTGVLDSYLLIDSVTVFSEKITALQITTSGVREMRQSTVAYLSDYYINMGEYIDFSLPANVSMFIDQHNNPVDLGADGSIPTASQPDMYFHGDYLDWFDNKGGAGQTVVVQGGFYDIETAKIVFKGFTVSTFELDCDSAPIYNCGGTQLCSGAGNRYGVMSIIKPSVMNLNSGDLPGTFIGRDSAAELYVTYSPCGGVHETSLFGSHKTQGNGYLYVITVALSDLRVLDMRFYYSGGEAALPFTSGEVVDVFIP